MKTILRTLQRFPSRLSFYSFCGVGLLNARSRLEWSDSLIKSVGKVSVQMLYEIWESEHWTLSYYADNLYAKITFKVQWRRRRTVVVPAFSISTCCLLTIVNKVPNYPIIIMYFIHKYILSILEYNNGHTLGKSSIQCFFLFYFRLSNRLWSKLRTITAYSQ